MPESPMHNVLVEIGVKGLICLQQRSPGFFLVNFDIQHAEHSILDIWLCSEYTNLSAVSTYNFERTLASWRSPLLEKIFRNSC